jgi:hypothetical protein
VDGRLNNRNQRVSFAIAPSRRGMKHPEPLDYVPRARIRS